MGTNARQINDFSSTSLSQTTGLEHHRHRKTRRGEVVDISTGRAYRTLAGRVMDMISCRLRTGHLPDRDATIDYLKCL